VGPSVDGTSPVAGVRLRRAVRALGGRGQSLKALHRLARDRLAIARGVACLEALPAGRPGEGRRREQKEGKEDGDHAVGEGADGEGRVDREKP
jgi:hypothetical protein